MKREVETKLAADAGFVLPDLLTVKGVAAEADRALLLRASYWDTEDLALARQGVSLRRRVGEGPPQWTLKLPTADGDGRWEVDVESRAARPPAALRELLTARLLGEHLHVVVEVRTARSARLLLGPDGEHLCEVVDDSVSAVGGTGGVWRELEVEVIGSAAVARKVVAVLEAAGAVVGSQASKSQQALGIVEQRAPVLDPSDPAGVLVHRVLGVGLADLRLHDAGVRTDQPDAVHQLRVTCRRLRSDLRAVRPLVDDPRVEPLRDELRWLAGELSAARDTEVLRERLRETAGDDLDVSALDAVLAEHEDADVARARAALSSPRYLALLAVLAALSTDVQLSARAAHPASDALPPLRRRARRRLDREVSGLALDQDDEVWHAVRKTAKKTRYVAESVASVLGGRATARRAKRVQTLLGEHADAVFTAERLQQVAMTHPELALLCGRLVERELAARDGVRRRLLAQR